MNLTNVVTYCIVVGNFTTCYNNVDAHTTNIIDETIKNGVCYSYPNHLVYSWFNRMYMEKEANTCPNGMYKLDLNTLTTGARSKNIRRRTTPPDEVLCCKKEVRVAPTVYIDGIIIGAGNNNI